MPDPLSIVAEHFEALTAAAGKARDSLQSRLLGYGGPKDRIRAIRPIRPPLLRPEEMDAVYLTPLGRRLVEMPATESTRRAWTWRPEGEEHDYATDAPEALQPDRLRRTMRDALASARQRGFALVVMVPDIDDEAELYAALAEPRPEAIELRRLQVVSGREAIPARWDDRLTSDDYGDPLAYQVTPIRDGGAPRSYVLHRSWAVRIQGLHIPADITQATPILSADLSVAQAYWEPIRDLVSALASGVAAAQLTATPRLKIARKAQATGARGGVLDDQSAAGELVQRLQTFRSLMGTLGMSVIDIGEELDYLSPRLTDLTEIIDQAARMVCAVEGWSQSDLFGDRPAGLGAADEQEIQRRAALIEGIREDIIAPAVDAILRVAVPDAPEGCTVHLDPVAPRDPPTEATTDATRATTASTLIMAGVIDPDEARAYLASGDRLADLELGDIDDADDLAGLPPLEAAEEIARDSDIPSLPDAARSSYRDGIRRHEAGETGDGTEATTIRMARRFAGGANPSREWLRTGWEWWGRNARFADAEPGTPAYASAQLWGGSAGQTYYRHHGERLFGED